MSVHKTKPILGRSIKLKAAAKRFKGGGGRASAASLNLTAMVDMFTLLVVFLLANFSATGEILFMSKEIELPKADSTAELFRAPVVSISPRAVSLEGREVATSDELERPDVAGIPDLTEKLQEIRRADEYLHPGQQFKGTVIVQCHKDVPFSIVRKVMYAAAEAGYADMNYAVMSKKGSLDTGPAKAE